TFERLRAEEQRIDERQAALAAGESEFERTAEERIARLTEWEQMLSAREAAIIDREAARQEAYSARELELAKQAADLASREAALVRDRQAAPPPSLASTPSLDPRASAELEERERARAGALSRPVSRRPGGAARTRVPRPRGGMDVLPVFATGLWPRTAVSRQVSTRS